MKNNGEIVEFLKKKDYVMLNNNLGSGAFGHTVLLKDPYIDELFVAKKYEPYYEEMKKEFYDSFLQEIKIMYALNHPNVVRVYNYYPYESSYTGYIIMEYIDGQNIEEYLKGYLPWDDPIDPDNIFVQLIDGFEYIEKKGIVHRDIREGNILITKDGIVKIIDFGLGKTFSPKVTSNDSMVEIINRSGLDCMPNEYLEGLYDSRTDMFYLAELFNRLLRKTNNIELFSYSMIIRKMMEPDRSNRYGSFAEIKEAMVTKDFSTFNITDTDKKVYQDFSNALKSCIANFIDKREYVTSTEEFANNLHSIIQKNCFEDYVQSINDFVSIIVKGEYSYYSQRNILCSVLTSFETWYISLSSESKKLVLNNLFAKLSTVKMEISDDYPF